MILCDVIVWRRGLLGTSLAFVYCCFVFSINFSLCPKANCLLSVSGGVVGEFTPFGQARIDRDELRKTHCLVSGHRSFVFHFGSVFTWSVHQRFCAVSFFFLSWVILCDVIGWQRGLLGISLAFVYCWFVFLISFSLCPKGNCVLSVSGGVDREFTPLGQARD